MTGGGDGRLRLGAVLGTVEQWHLDCLRGVAEVEGVELAGVARVAPSRPPAGPVSRWARRRETRQASTEAVEAALRGVPQAAWTEEGWAGSPAPDAVLALGVGPLRGRGEVWSFRHEREWYERGDPLSLGARLRRDPVAYVSLDAGERPLRAAWVRTIDDSWRQHHREVESVLARWPSQLVRGAPRLTPPDPPGDSPPRVGSLRLALLVGRMAARRLRRLAGGALRHDAWNVGVLPAPAQSLLAGEYPRPRWMKPLPGRYLADPFGIELDGRVHVLLEDYSLKRRKAVISHCELGADGVPGPPAPVLELATHASYPYLVRDRDRVYLIPETGDAREVALYEATDFPRGWTRRATLLDDVFALDATVFRHGDRWWLLASVEEGGQLNLALHGWHAPDLLGPWTPHAANPLKLDVRSARPAGTPFIHDGRLHRPAQDCARGYGRAVVINRVDVLSPTDFAETPVAVLRADDFVPYTRGLHTLAGVGALTLVDGNRSRFDRHALRAALGRRARQVFSR